MEYDINDIPIQIEGININNLPSTSDSQLKIENTHESSDENESEG